MARARVLLLVTTTSYRTDAFLEAARRLGAEGVVGSDRCHVLDGVYEFPPDSLALDFRHPEAAAAQIVDAAKQQKFDAIIGTSDGTSVVAALASRALGLRASSPDAARTAKNKRLMREALTRAGVACPRFGVVDLDGAPDGVADRVGYPCVVKPLLLSASRGVIRADDPASLAEAFARVTALLSTPELRAAAAEDPDGARVLVEEFVPGAEVAVEGILRDGRLDVVALFDKPDPLEGPFFEETIYVTPSRLDDETQRRIADTTARAAAAMGLVEGPVHAELRLPATGTPTVIEVAARTIGGLCARTLRFSLGEPGGFDGSASLEELVVARALGRLPSTPPRERVAAGVMMLPIPSAGVLQSVEGIEDAAAVRDVVGVEITTRVGEKVVPLPEGASYLGFLFARAATPAAVENALRAAHAKLRFTIAPLL